ncbi:hypothetical protein [Halodesulfovibrio sp.]|uniref:hypothetical protein n=1 Tax=Halodesulfovibrio sp. TaxID=1912772 RepID=UPI0025C73A12|nr:hypothetical protein [Halodesulfovibrio sp.]
MHHLRHVLQEAIHNITIIEIHGILHTTITTITTLITTNTDTIITTIIMVGISMDIMAADIMVATMAGITIDSPLAVIY